MLNCFDINLHIHPLKEGIDIKSYGTARHSKIPFNDINHDLISFLHTLNLDIVHSELFYTPAFYFTTIHIDEIGGDYTKLNYVFTGKNSLMNWWKQKPNTKTIIGTTVINTHYIDYNVSDVDLIDKQQVNFPSVVQVGIPHNIRNFEEPRYCLSLVLSKQRKSRITMAESIEIFKDYL
jgi:hypothetical protein